MDQPTRPKIAAVVTTYFKYSHAQHIVDRFLDGYGWNGTHHYPPMDLVSLYVDQVGSTDLSRERASRHPTMKLCASIPEALTLGGSKLAVDGVVLVGEHGRYPRNEKGQTEYPRYEFFKQIVERVPLERPQRARLQRQAPFLELGMGPGNVRHRAPARVPVHGRFQPARHLAHALGRNAAGARISEALCVCYGGVDSYDFHGLETIQCMVERRRGGETGVKWIQAYRGDKFWEALREGVWPRALMESALCRSHTLTPARPNFNNVFPSTDDMRRLVSNPVAYRYEHADGVKGTMLLMGGLVRDFNFAAYVNGAREPWSTQMYLPMPDGRTTLANFFSPLVNHMEQMFLTGKSGYPVERTLLTTGLTAFGVDSLFRGQVRVETPQLAIRYQPTKESTFWRT